jgi:hypothetical protein
MAICHSENKVDSLGFRSAGSNIDRAGDDERGAQWRLNRLLKEGILVL